MKQFKIFVESKRNNLPKNILQVCVHSLAGIALIYSQLSKEVIDSSFVLAYFFYLMTGIAFIFVGLAHKHFRRRYSFFIPSMFLVEGISIIVVLLEKEMRQQLLLVQYLYIALIVFLFFMAFFEYTLRKNRYVVFDSQGIHFQFNIFLKSHYSWEKIKKLEMENDELSVITTNSDYEYKINKELSDSEDIRMIKIFLDDFVK